MTKKEKCIIEEALAKQFVAIANIGKHIDEDDFEKLSSSLDAIADVIGANKIDFLYMQLKNMVLNNAWIYPSVHIKIKYKGEMYMFKFKIPVGDWSNDGHGKCDYFIVQSNKPVKEVREAHFKIKEVTGFDIDNFCSGYGENWCDEHNMDILNKLGFVITEKTYGFDDVTNNDDEDEENGCYVYSDGFVEIWIYLLMKVDKDLKLKIIDEEYESLTFYGFDDKGRHIGSCGYGLFD